jgi:hypothetical protein
MSDRLHQHDAVRTGDGAALPLDSSSSNPGMTVTFILVLWGIVFFVAMKSMLGLMQEGSAGLATKNTKK